MQIGETDLQVSDLQVSGFYVNVAVGYLEFGYLESAAAQFQVSETPLHSSCVFLTLLQPTSISHRLTTTQDRKHGDNEVL